VKKIFIGLLFLLTPVILYAADLTDQTEDTSPTSDDLIYTVNDPAGTPADRKVTLSNATKGLADATTTTKGVASFNTSHFSVSSGAVSSTLAPSATALAANGGNCSAGNAPLGVDASGAIESCFDVWTEAENTAAGYTSNTGDIEGVTAGAGLGGGGTSGTVSLNTDSSEAAFLASGALTCGAGTAGKVQVHTTPLQYCDNTATPALQYAAYGSSTGVATSATALAADPADCGANTFATTIAASGALTCASIGDADVPNTITIDNATTAANLGADGVDALTEIAQGIKTAANDTSPLVIGTAGANGEIAKWNTDGTLTDSNVIIGTVTDGKWCSYASSGTLLSCTQDAPAGSGDITDVFSCASGDCASITMAATDLLDMSGTDASTATEGLILPQHATACAGGTAEGQVCWEADANILHMGDGATLVDFVPTSAFSSEATVSTTGAVTLADSVTVTGWVLGTSSATQLTSPTVLIDLLDGVGAVDMDYGSADITDHTFIADGTTDGDFVVPNTSIGAAEIVLDDITHSQIADADQMDTKCLWFEDPAAADDFNSIWFNGTGNDFQVTEIWAESDQTVTFMLQLDDGTPADCDTVDLAPAAGTAEDTSLDGDCLVAAGERLDLAVTSVASTPTWVSICFTGNWVD